MMKCFRAIFLFLIFFTVGTNCDTCEQKATYTIYQNSKDPVAWEDNTNLTSYGCKVNEKITFFSHGFNDFLAWVPKTVEKFLEFRGGCVIFLNFSPCFDTNNYLTTFGHFDELAGLVTKKLKQMNTEGISGDNMHLYGFSLSAQMMIKGAIDFGKQLIGSMDLCEPASVPFDLTYSVDRKMAAKNVQSIFTSFYSGSTIRTDSHQNWLMGNCGICQDGADDVAYFKCAVQNCKENVPLGSHTICPELYNSAFDNDFFANNVNHCWGVTKNAPSDFKMGYNEQRKHIRGVFASPTSKDYPYTGNAGDNSTNMLWGALGGVLGILGFVLGLLSFVLGRVFK